MSEYDNVATTAPYYVACTDPSDEGGLISDQLRDILEGTFQVVFCSIVSVFGSVANLMNIIVFCKQGFSDTINISLLGLAIADLCTLLFFILTSILRIPVFEGSKIFLDTCGIYYLVASWPKACFAVIGSWIIVFITFERCLCIAQPLQVKTVITKRRAMLVIIAIFGAIFAFMLPPLFYAFRLGPRYVMQYNRTLVVTFQIDNGMDGELAVVYFIIFSQTSTFVIVIICTVVLIRSLALKSKWRRETANISGPDSRNAMSSRDKSVAKLVISISCIFIFCFLPSVLSPIITVYFSPHFAMNGRYENMFIATWAILNFFQPINSSFNIIIYFKMSSKHRAVFTSMFCLSY